MHRNKSFRPWLFLWLPCLVWFVLLPHNALAQSITPTAQRLVEAINNFREDRQMPVLTINRYLMQSAQEHAEYLASIGYLDHKGSGKTNETDRAVASGYESGQNTICDEALAYTGPGVDLDSFFKNAAIWNNYEHRDVVFLNPRYVDLGAGVAEKNGSFYYVAVLCVNHSSSVTPQVSGPYPPGGTTQRAPTLTPTSDKPVPVEVSTARPDGSVVHVVEKGQVLWDIAFAYGVNLTDLATSNGLSPSRPVIYIGQEIVISRALTATPSPTATATSKPPTRTLRPSRTPSDPSLLPAISPTPTGAPKPVLPALQRINRRHIGIFIVALCGLGLLLVLLTNPKAKKDE